MLVQRCALDQHRLVIPVSLSKPEFRENSFFRSPTGNRYRALVDTGAQRTVVAASIIAQNRLVRTGHLEFAGLHGPRTHTRYLATMGLWARRIDSSRTATDFDSSEETLFSLEEPIEIVNMDDNRNFDLILGFDVLKQFGFSFDATSRTFEIIIKP